MQAGHRCRRVLDLASFGAEDFLELFEVYVLRGEGGVDFIQNSRVVFRLLDAVFELSQENKA